MFLSGKNDDFVRMYWAIEGGRLMTGAILNANLFENYN